MLYSYDECEAALCLWEECLHRISNARKRAKSAGESWIDAQDNEELWNWLRGGEGAACARSMCIDLARDIEQSYMFARDLGFDDSFDWEFVPRWADHAMDVSEEHYLDEKWNRYIAAKVVEDWKNATNP